jgi:hypothetical protein
MAMAKPAIISKRPIRGQNFIRDLETTTNLFSKSLKN